MEAFLMNIDESEIGRAESKYAKKLETIVMTDPILSEILRKTLALGIKDARIGAGCVVQTVWNVLFSKPAGHGIRDIDWVYFEEGDRSEAMEQDLAAQLKELEQSLGSWGISVDVKNQARVHEWYGHRFGNVIQPYGSIEHAIDSWPTTATAIGVWLDENRGFQYYAPFGLSDLFNGIVRPNPKQVPRSVYEQKSERWQAVWPELVVQPWYAYRLRQTRPEDSEAVFALKKLTLKPYIEIIWGWDEAFQRRDFNESFNPMRHFWIDWHCQSVGILELSENNRTLELIEFEIHPEYQGKGLGSMVLKGLLEDCRQKKKDLSLGCFKVNQEALKFYKRHGFKVVDETKTHFLLRATFN